MQQLCFFKHKVFIQSDVWVDNLAHEEHFFCAAFSDDDHKWTIELQNRDVAEGQKRDADACSSCSGGSGLVHIQGGLVHNLQSDGGRVRWREYTEGQTCAVTYAVLTSETASFWPSAMPLKSARSPNMSVIPISDNTLLRE